MFAIAELHARPHLSRRAPLLDAGSSRLRCWRDLFAPGGEPAPWRCPFRRSVRAGPRPRRPNAISTTGVPVDPTVRWHGNEGLQWGKGRRKARLSALDQIGDIGASGNSLENQASEISSLFPCRIYVRKGVSLR